MKKSVLLVWMVLFSLSLIPLAYAVDELSQFADRLNYEGTQTHTVTVSNGGAEDVAINISILPSGWSFSSGSGCGAVSSAISCNISAGGSTTYTITSPASDDDYTTTLFFINETNNSFTSVQDANFLAIQDREIFHTLVEFGRGRGNYFFDSYASGLAGSGKTGVGCRFLPNASLFELNFLHKILNVKQYFNLPTSIAKNATFSCRYPNSTIVRFHLSNSITREAEFTNVTYLIGEVEGSWERMGYLGMDYDVGEFLIGENVSVNCTGITYTLNDAGGNMTVVEDSFSLEIRDRTPFSAEAFAAQTIGNGTQEVIINYNVTNNEKYKADNVIIEINAPQFGQFIGTRAELWGYALDQYRIEKIDLEAGETESIELVVRYDTTFASVDGFANNLTTGIDINYITCWEANAYNPQEYTQTVVPVQAPTIDMSVGASIISIIDRLNEINTTITNIESTVNDIQTTVTLINITTGLINATVNDIQTTVAIINGTVDFINSTLVLVQSNVQTIIDLVNCSGTESLLCNITIDINNTVNKIDSDIENINNTLLDINTTFNIRFDDIDNNLTEIINLVNNNSLSIDEVKSLVNCSDFPNAPICVKLDNISTLVFAINNTVRQTLDFLNLTIWGSLTAQDIFDKIGNSTTDTERILSDIQELRDFDQELVFLVTDAFGLQQQAQIDAGNGDLIGATDKLREANARLNEAAARLYQTQVNVAEGGGLGSPAVATASNNWLLPLIVIVFLVIIGIYLFSRVPEDQEPPLQPPVQRYRRIR